MVSALDVIDTLEILRYVVLSIELAIPVALLLWPYVWKYSFCHRESQKLILLPIYSVILIIDIIITVIAFPVVHLSTETYASHILEFVAIIYSASPLMLVYRESLPRSRTEIAKALAISFVPTAVLVIYDIASIDTNVAKFYGALGIVILPVIAMNAFLFRKNPRTYKNLTVISHTLLLTSYIAITLAILYYAVFVQPLVTATGEFKYNLPLLIYLRVAVWFAMNTTSIIMMYMDTRYWNRIIDFEAQRANTVIADRLTEGFLEFEHEHHAIFIPYGNIDIRQHLATGGRSEVYMAVYRGKKVALKVYTPRVITPEELRKWSHEVGLSVLLQHPNVIKCYGVVVVPPRVMVVLEYCRRSLSDYLANMKLSTLMAISFMIDIAAGVDYLHARNVIHRDIKPENIMVCHCDDNNVSAKIIDFGESRFVVNTSMTITGTPQYIAPEVLRLAPNSETRAYYDEKIDVFSMAVVFWEILHGRDVYPPEWSKYDILEAIQNGYHPPIDEGLRTHHLPLMQLIERMWRPNPAERPNTRQVYTQLIEYQKKNVMRILDGSGDDRLWTEDNIMTYFITNKHTIRRTESRKLITFIKKHNLVPLEHVDEVRESEIMSELA